MHFMNFIISLKSYSFAELFKIIISIISLLIRVLFISLFR